MASICKTQYLNGRFHREREEKKQRCWSVQQLQECYYLMSLCLTSCLSCRFLQYFAFVKFPKVPCSVVAAK